MLYSKNQDAKEKRSDFFLQKNDSPTNIEEEKFSFADKNPVNENHVKQKAIQFSYNIEKIVSKTLITFIYQVFSSYINRNSKFEWK